MNVDDPRHGSTRGYAQGCRCTPCKEGRNRYERNRKKRRAVLGIQQSVDVTGTRRRIHALMALGWPGHEIARRCEWETGEAVFEVTRRAWVQRQTAETIARVYDQLCMTVGPSVQTRARARRNGWAVPLAWDDIDDRAEIPSTGWKPVRNRPAAELFAELDHLTSLGVSEWQAAKQLGVTPDAIEKARERAGRVA